MDNQTKDRIITQFDTNGFLIYITSKALTIDFSIPEETISRRYNLKIEKHDYNKIYVLETKSLSVSSDEANFLLLEYLKNKGVEIAILTDIDNYKVLNGKPFLILSEVLNIPELDFRRQYRNVTFASKTYNYSITFYEHDFLNDLGPIEEIKGSLGFSGCSMFSLGGLKTVGGNLWVAQETKQTQLNDLGDLSFVGGSLNLKNTNVTDLGKLEYVGENLNLRGLNIENFGNLRYVGGNILMSEKFRNVHEFSNVEIKGKVKFFRD